MNLSTFYDQAPPSDTPVATPKASPWLPQALPLKASPLTTTVPPPTTFRSGPRFLAQLCSLRSEKWDLRSEGFESVSRYVKCKMRCKIWDLSNSFQIWDMKLVSVRRHTHRQQQVVEPVRGLSGWVQEGFASNLSFKLLETYYILSSSYSVIICLISLYTYCYNIIDGWP